MKGLFLAALLLIAGAGCGDKFVLGGGGTTSSKIALSGSVLETLAKPSSKPAGGAGVLRSPMSGGDVKVIDTKGKAVGTATIASDGTYSASVAKGDNYTVKATKGNVCLKSFVEKADADKTVTVDPTSSAIVKALSKKIGDGNLGEEGHDVSTAISSVDVSAILVAIKSDSLLTAVAQAIAADITANANYSSTTVTAGYASMAGDTDANAIAISITVTVTITVTPQSVAPAAPTGVTATAGDGAATASWSAVTEATSYNLYYSTTAGTAGIKVGGITATSYTLNGLSNGVTYYFTVTAVNASGESAASAQVSVTPTTTAVLIHRPIADTGQTTKYSTVFGDDSDYLINPPSFTDNVNGTITDNVTSLMWQKRDDATVRDWATAGTYCADLSLSGYSDWRVPTKKELMSIENFGTIPAIDTTYFPETQSSRYWSSTTVPTYTDQAWIVSFDSGKVIYGFKTASYYARCVRGAPAVQSFTDNGNGTTTDNVTGLMWQKDLGNFFGNWEEAISYCEGLTLAGLKWRLPNVRELESIADETRPFPAVDATYFTATFGWDYWASTTYAGNADNAWKVYLYIGGIFSGHRKDFVGVAKCVRP